MPDDNRLAGIGEQLDEDSNESTDVVDSKDSSEVPESPESVDSRESVVSGGGMDDDPQAIGADETSKTTVYGTDETLREYSTALDLARARAIEDYGLEEIQARELHNAALQVAADNIDAIAERVSEERTDE